MKSWSAVLVLGALVLAGCADDTTQRSSGKTTASASASATAEPTGSASPSPSSTATRSSTLPRLPELGHDPEARRELRQAIRSLVLANTGTYRLDFGATGAGIQERGSYRVAPRAFAIRRYLSTEEGTYTFDLVAVGPTSWMKAIDAPGDGAGGWPCWVDTADLAGSSPELAGLLTSEVATTQPPNALIAASYGVGREYTDLEMLGTILGTIDLVAATSLLGSQAVLKLDLDPASKATAPAYFDVRDGRLQGFTIGLQGLFLALEAEGVDPPVDPRGRVPGTIKVAFEDPGAPVEISAPSPQEVVDIPAGQDSFRDEMAACGNRQG